MRFRGFSWSNLALHLKEFDYLSTLHSNVHNRRLFLQSQRRKSIFSDLRFYSTELQPQLSSELIKIMEKRLSSIEHRSSYLLGLVNQPEASPAEYSRANKELRNLKGSMDLIKELRTKQKDIEGLKALMAECPEDKEILNMATEELSQAVEEERRLQNQLLQSLLPKDDADERGCILEVRAGTGGEEASLFAMDIFEMYERYSLKKGWMFDVVEITESDLKGYKEASAAISGADVYGKLKFESGVHRVQRVPVTEKSGRIHTSAVSVAILPQADEVDVQLRLEDLRIDTYRSGGSGGQHANTTNSAVRITHLPSGITVSIQDERSQHMIKLWDVHVQRILTSGMNPDPFRLVWPEGHHSKSLFWTDQISGQHIPIGLWTCKVNGKARVHEEGKTNGKWDENKAKAMKVLCARLYEIERSRIHTNRSKLRSEQIGSGDRSERIRTYNFPQGRVTDHCVGITHHSINDVMQGENLDIFIDALLLQQEMDAVASFSSEQ